MGSFSPISSKRLLSPFRKGNKYHGSSGVGSSRRENQDIVEGRRIWRASDDSDLGMPTNVDPNFVHKSVRQKIADGWSNANLMREGYTPIGKDGRQINLHHILGDEPGPMAEILGSTHQKYQRQLHGLIEDGSSFRNTPGLESQYNAFRRRYWEWRLDQLQGTEGN